MNNMKIFEKEEFGQVRVIRKNNEPWFVGKDIAEILGYSNTSKAVLMHVDEDEKAEFPIWDGRQNRKTYLINESGMYSLILSSKLPSAKRFKRWITHEVIPSIRKHGTYMTDEKIEEVLTDPDTIIKIATQLKEEKEKRLQAERFNKQIAASQNSLLVREVAKVASKKGIVIGEKRLWNKLRNWGLILKDSTEPKQTGMDRGYFEVNEGVKETRKGTFTYRTTRVTGKGQAYIIDRLIKEKSEEAV